MRTYAIVSEFGTTLATYSGDTPWVALRAFLADRGDKRAKSKNLAVTRVNDELWLDGITVRETKDVMVVLDEPFGLAWAEGR